MLEEYFHYLGVRTSGRGARLLGYAHEAAALQVRHRRCRAAWQSHIQATHKALLTAAHALPNAGGTALIIGGGNVHDLPVRQLLNCFEQIVLLDIAFAYSTRRLAARWPGRVVCCLHDVTSVVDWLAKHRKLPPEILFSTPELPAFSPHPRWVASVNCLSQLPLLPIDWLYDHDVNQAELEWFGQKLIQAHLNWLRAWQTPVCLITEIEDQRFNRHNVVEEVIDYRPLLREFLQPARRVAGWTWRLKPPGELSDGGWENRSVEAYSIDQQ